MNLKSPSSSGNGSLCGFLSRREKENKWSGLELGPQLERLISAKTAIISIPHSLYIIQLNVRSRQSIFFKIEYDGPLGLIREPGVDIRPLRTGQTACCEKDNSDVESGHRIVVLQFRRNYHTFNSIGLVNQPFSRKSRLSEILG